MRPGLLLLLACLLGFCSTPQDLLAQGLLGKGHVSGQYLLVKFSDHDIPNFDGFDSGARVMLNLPVIPWETQQSSRVGFDAFVNGYGFRLSDDVGYPPILQLNLDNVGVEAGGNLFFCVTEKFRPFLQLGVQSFRLEVDAAFNGFSILHQEIKETNLIAGAGLEWDFLPALALQSSVVFGSEFISETEFRNDLIIRPGENWFGRLSVIANTQSDVVIGFGGGIAW